MRINTAYSIGNKVFVKGGDTICGPFEIVRINTSIGKYGWLNIMYFLEDMNGVFHNNELMSVQQATKFLNKKK